MERVSEKTIEILLNLYKDYEDVEERIIYLAVEELKLYRDAGLTTEEVQRLSDLKKQDRLMELPCK